MLLFDFGEGGFEAPPLRFVLFAALGFCEGVGEGRCVLLGRGQLVVRLERNDGFYCGYGRVGWMKDEGPRRKET